MGQPPRKLPWRECLMLVGLVAIVGFVMALGVHHGCTHAPPPVDGPVPGSPRAGYCATADTGRPWLLTLLVAGLAVTVVLASRRRATVVVWSCVLIAIAVFVLA